jgi:hypothetical protein
MMKWLLAENEAGGGQVLQLHSYDLRSQLLCACGEQSMRAG